MANIMENQASTQSTLPEQKLSNMLVATAPASAQPMTPELQAVWTELAQIAGNPEAMKAKAQQFGLGAKYDTTKSQLEQIQARAMELQTKEDSLKKQFEELAIRAKGTSSKMMAGVIGAVIAGGFLGFKAVHVDSSSIKKTSSAIGGLIAGGLIGGLVGRLFVGSKIQSEAKGLAVQAQQIDVAKEQIANDVQNIQQPFIMELAGKMAEAKKTGIVPMVSGANPPAPPITAPAAAAITPPSPPSAEAQQAAKDRDAASDPTQNGDPTKLIDDTAKLADQSIKLGDQSIKLGDQSIAQSPAEVSQQSGVMVQNRIMEELNKPSGNVSQQSFTAGIQPNPPTAGIKPRGAGFADAAANEQLAGAGAVQGR